MSAIKDIKKQKEYAVEKFWQEECTMAHLRGMSTRDIVNYAFLAGRRDGLDRGGEICRTAKLSFYRDRMIDIGESDLIDLALLDVARQIEGAL